MSENGNDKYWVGFDLGGTKMQATVFDGKFKAKESERRKTKAHEGAKAGVERMIETIGRAVEKAGVAGDRIAGIGVGVPGPLDLDSGVLLESANLGWKDVELRKDLEKAFGCPAIILNDVDAGVYAEYRFGAARKARCVIGVFPGTGIGGGCIYEGKILRGRTNSCFEIGHCQVLPGGPLCGCGQRGCLEAVASRLAIAGAAAQAALRGEAPNLLKIAGAADLTEIRSRALADSIKAGDKAVERIVKDAAGGLGGGIPIAVSLVAPDVVVLGGGLVEAMPELLRSEVEEAARKHVMRSMRGSFEVVVAKLGDDATATGAAAWAQRTVTGEEREPKD
jgi:glucokinase